MKIALDTHPAAPAEHYIQHLAKLLARHAPQHEYFTDGESDEAFDIYHGFRSGAPAAPRLRHTVTVFTVSDLRFLRFPHLFDLSERLFGLRHYRQALRSAARVIALNTPAREELAERLQVDRRKIEVMLPLGALAPRTPPSEEELRFVRRKYALPDEFVLMVGPTDGRCHQPRVFEALLATGLPSGFVVCGRRSPCSDRLLNLARERRAADRIDFVYESEPREFTAFFHLARVFVQLSDADAEASIVPVVEALRAGVPMLLNDTPVNRETAGQAALYVRPDTPGELTAALRLALRDEPLRRELRLRERQRARLFSEQAVAQRLADLYASLPRSRSDSGF